MHRAIFSIEGHDFLHGPRFGKTMVLSDLLGASTERLLNSSDLSSFSPKSGSSSSATESAASIKRTTSAQPNPASHHVEYISDESQLHPVEPEAPDLRELNACLEALAAVFPDIQIEVFREMLSCFDGESRLALVADALLKNRTTWVKGRWRVLGKDHKEEANDVGVTNGTLTATDSERLEGKGVSLVPDSQSFKSPAYKNAVKRLAFHEFRGLSKPRISAVLAEFNYSYLDARKTLVDLSSKSWRFTISSIFLRRKPVTCTRAENHPLVVWKPTGHGSNVPCLQPTGHAELDKELFRALIMPVRTRAREQQMEEDRALAMKINNDQAEEEGQIFECACCYADAAFEEYTSCNADGHLICFRCVQKSIHEAVFGQGWQSMVNKETGTIKCPAVESDACQGCIDSFHMHRAMLEDKNGARVLRKFQQRLAESSLVASNLPLIRCSFCDYVEVDDLYLFPAEMKIRVRLDSLVSLVLVLVLVCMTPLVFPVGVLASLFAVLFSPKKGLGDYFARHLKDAFKRQRQRRRGLRFECQDPACRRSSCLGCGKGWVDVHICHENALVTLRTQVEQAMSMAIKRVCPRCNTSFVKTTGCNKLTCPCGYKMCYVCRKDISTKEGPDAGYQHFCDHFRPHGDPKKCTQCTKCNLWEAENTDELLQQAKEKAERMWLETEKRALTGADKAYLETGLLLHTAMLPSSRVPTMAECCDWLVETMIV